MGGHLQPVLDTLVYLKQKTNTWLEITTLLIPGENSFHPDWRMQEKPRTEAVTQAKARRTAKAAGIRYAYVGNVFDEEGASTHCHQCGSKLIGRNWHRITAYNLTGDARCAQCGARVAGVFS